MRWWANFFFCFCTIEKKLEIVADYYNKSTTVSKCSRAMKRTKVMCGGSNYKRWLKKNKIKTNFSEWFKQDLVTCMKIDSSKKYNSNFTKKKKKNGHHSSVISASIYKHVSVVLFLVRLRRREEHGQHTFSTLEIELNRTNRRRNSEIKTQYYILLNYEYFVPTRY